jgi:RNA polymerase-binding transcription factor DksA
VSTKKRATKKSPAKKAASTAGAAKSSKATKAAKSAKSPAKKTAQKTAKKTAKKAAAKKAAAKRTAAKKSTKKAGSKAPAKKATARKNVAQSKTASKGNDSGSGSAIPAKYKYLHDEQWLARQREALLRERASYTTSADRLAAEAAALMADREPGDVQFDEESGEGDTIAVERDRDLALSAAARQSVAEIDAALERLDNKTYGICIAGDDIIPRERLEAIPEAAVCVMHKTLMF